jgi:hypothetical protein
VHLGYISVCFLYKCEGNPDEIVLAGQSAGRGIYMGVCIWVYVYACQKVLAGNSSGTNIYIYVYV